jgi:hypothetical protein
MNSTLSLDYCDIHEKGTDFFQKESALSVNSYDEKEECTVDL